MNFQTPVEFALNYSLVQTRPVMDYTAGGNNNDLPNINEFPILNQAQAKKKFQATFDRDCGDDDICQADIQLSPKLTDKVKIANILSTEFCVQVFCQQNNGPLFQDSKELPRTPGGEFYQLQLGSLRNSELVLELGINNPLEPAYESRLDIEFPASVSYIGTGPDSKLNLPVTGKTLSSVRLAISKLLMK